MGTAIFPKSSWKKFSIQLNLVLGWVWFPLDKMTRCPSLSPFVPSFVSYISLLLSELVLWMHRIRRQFLLFTFDLCNLPVHGLKCPIWWTALLPNQQIHACFDQAFFCNAEHPNMSLRQAECFRQLDLAILLLWKNKYEQKLCKWHLFFLLIF